MDKKTFLKLTSLGLFSLLSASAKNKLQFTSGEKLSSDESFWDEIRKLYEVNPNFINLENGYYCIMPIPVKKGLLNHIDAVNAEGALFMRKKQFERKKELANMLAKTIGCNSEELIITRNTTEALNMVISGFPWQKGDEAIMAMQDYGAMLDMFKQVEKRHQIKNTLVSVPLHPKSDEEIVALYEKAITQNTKLIMVCHMINITGHILPVKKIIAMAHRYNIPVLVDGAHAFGHFKFNFEELNADFYGCSLHKWLSAPLGSGFLYISKKYIPAIWPLFAESNLNEKDVARLNHTGTIPVHNEHAIENAIAFYSTIGSERKETRLRYLKDYWVNNLKNDKGIVINTPFEKNRSCAIGNIGIEGIKPEQLAKILFEKYKIFTVAIDYAGVSGVRVTPNLYTNTQELDQFVLAIKEINQSK